MRRDITVDKEGDGRILRSWLAPHLPEVPSKGIRRAIQRGQVIVDGDRVSSNLVLKEGQTVSVHIQDKFNNTPDIPGMSILFEDDHLAAIFKPAGVEVHGSRGPLLVGAIKKIITLSPESDALLNPAILHRLDKPTCGVLLIAKTRSSLKSLAGQFQSRSIIKEYLAVVHGTLESEISIDDPIDGKAASTKAMPHDVYKSTRIEFGSTLKAFPSTGRKHQIRKHLAAHGHPIAGDKTYGKDDGINQLLLCAHSVTFEHPDGSEQSVSCNLPEFFACSR